MPRLILTDLPTDTESIRRSSGLPPGWIHDRWSRRCLVPPPSKPSSAWGDGAAPLVPPREPPGAKPSGVDDPKWLCPNTPYLLGPEVSAGDLILMNSLAPPGIASPLTCLSMAYGGETTLALADIVHDLRADAPDGFNVAGAAADVFHARIEGFSQAVERSQRSILAYRNAVRTGGSTSAAREQLVQANRELNQRFQVELRSANSRMSAHYRALTSTDETTVTDKIRQTPKVAKLDVASRFEADRLVGLARYARRIGNGLVVIELGKRIAEVYEAGQSGEDWRKESFVKLGSLLLESAVATRTARLAAGLMGVVLVETPAGWALLALGATASLTIGATGIDRSLQASLAAAYDQAASWFGKAP